MKRTANAHWTGNLKEGKGEISTQSTVLDNTRYSFSTRFEEGKGTNPEELLGASHAGCFTMALSFSLEKEGYTAGDLSTRAVVEFDTAALKITGITLELTAARVEGLSEEKLTEIARDAKENCVISKALSATPITLQVNYQ